MAGLDSIVNDLLIPWFKQRANYLSLPSMRSPSMVPGQSAGSMGAGKYAPAPGFNGARGQPFPPMNQGYGVPATRPPSWPAAPGGGGGPPAMPPGPPGVPAGAPSNLPVPYKPPGLPAPPAAPAGSLAGSPGSAAGLLGTLTAMGLAPALMGGGGGSGPAPGGGPPPTFGNTAGPPMPPGMGGPQFGPPMPPPQRDPNGILLGNAALGLTPSGQSVNAAGNPYAAPGQGGKGAGSAPEGGTQGPNLIAAIIDNLKKNARGMPDLQGGNSGNGVYQGNNGWAGSPYGPY